MVYNDKISSFEELLEKDRSFSKQTRNRQILATEMFKVYRYMSTPITCEIFNRHVMVDKLCNFSQLGVSYVKYIHHGT